MTDLDEAAAGKALFTKVADYIVWRRVNAVWGKPFGEAAVKDLQSQVHAFVSSFERKWGSSPARCYWAVVVELWPGGTVWTEARFVDPHDEYAFYRWFLAHAGVALVKEMLDAASEREGAEKERQRRNQDLLEILQRPEE